MKAIPDIRASRPRKWFWLVNIIPSVEIWHNQVFIGLWHQPKHVGQWNPVMTRRRIVIDRFSVSFWIR